MSCCSDRYLRNTGTRSEPSNEPMALVRSTKPNHHVGSVEVAQGEGEEEGEKADRTPDDRHRREREHDVGDIQRKSEPLPLPGDVDAHLALAVGGGRASVQRAPGPLGPATWCRELVAPDRLALGCGCRRLGDERAREPGSLIAATPPEQEDNESEPEHPRRSELQETHRHG